MPKDYKKLFLEEQTSKLKTELEMNNLKKEIDELKKNSLFSQNQHQQFQQQPYGGGSPIQQPVQPASQFEADVKYIVGLSQRMSYLLKECRTLMLPMDLGKRIDAVLREIDRL